MVDTTVKCTDCDWQASGKTKISVLKSGFFHEIGQGHDLRDKDKKRIEEEFDL